MLDDLKFIHQRDAQDALGVAGKQWQQLLHKYETRNWKLETGNIENVIVAGMGGSALAAAMVKSWPSIAVPFEVVRDYQLPGYAGPSTLVIGSSYSGNTEETLSALQQAEANGCQIAVIAANGKLGEIAKQKQYPFLELPANFQPRMAVLANLKALICLLESAGLIDGKVAELEQAANWLGEVSSTWRADAPTPKNQAKQIAQELMGKSAVIYSGPLLSPAAYKWKININENAKTVAWCNQYPEFNHNEFLGWTSHPVDKPYAVVDLRSNLEHPRVQKRFEITEKLLSGKRPAPIVVEVQGETVLQQLLWSIALGDFVSIYLALLNNVDPTPVDLIEKLKSALND